MYQPHLRGLDLAMNIVWSPGEMRWITRIQVTDAFFDKGAFTSERLSRAVRLP